MKNYCVLCQGWEESERGWGVRPDGYSLHLTELKKDEYISEYWAKCPPGPPPDEYSRPSGKPFWIMIDEETFKDVKSSTNGKRYYDSIPKNNKEEILIEEIKGLIEAEMIGRDFCSEFARRRIIELAKTISS